MASGSGTRGARPGRGKQRPEGGGSKAAAVAVQGLLLLEPEPGVVHLVLSPALPPAGVSSGEGATSRSMAAAIRTAASPFAVLLRGGVSTSCKTPHGT